MLMAEGEPPSLPPCTTVLPKPPRAIVSCPFRHARRLWSTPLLWLAACRGLDARDRAQWGARVSAHEALDRMALLLCSRALERGRAWTMATAGRPPVDCTSVVPLLAVSCASGGVADCLKPLSCLKTALDEIDVTEIFKFR